MNMASKISGYIKRRFFSGLVSSALSSLILLCLLVVSIGSLVAWGFSWLTAVVILLSLQITAAFFALSVQNYYARAASTRIEQKVTSTVRSNLQSYAAKLSSSSQTLDDHAAGLSADFEQQLSSAKSDLDQLLAELREQLAPLVEQQETRLTQINEASLRMHREVTYIFSQLREADRPVSDRPENDCAPDSH